MLLARRKESAHQGGLWEFPGGKIEAGESTREALGRELDEELGVSVAKAHPLIHIHHDYAEFSVHLDVWRVVDFGGSPRGREGQQIAWVHEEKLHEYRFPEANLAIVRALKLPPYYAIVDAGDGESDQVLGRCAELLQRPDCLLRVRRASLCPGRYEQLLEALCIQAGARANRLMIDAGAGLELDGVAAGIHMNSACLMAASIRPLPAGYWTAASCHSLAELQHAQAIGLDFAVLSPLRSTPSHPGATPIGWQRFEHWVHRINLPVYVLGGMGTEDLARAQYHGAQGIAAIRAFSRSGASGQ